MLLDGIMIAMLIGGFGLLKVFINWNDKQLNK